MTICKDSMSENIPGSRQIYSHVKKTETPMQDVKALMLAILKQYQQADKIGFSLGVMDKPASFADAVSWCSVIGKMDRKKEALDESSKGQLKETLEYLDTLVDSFDKKVVTQIQKYRDKWMRRVLIWDFSIISLLVLALFAATFWPGISLDQSVVQGYLQERPVFFSLTALILGVVLIRLHFFIRRVVMDGLMRKAENKLPPGMSLPKALSCNTGVQHSIFRPYPVGWNMLQKLRLKVIRNKLNELHQQMVDVLEKSNTVKPVEQ